MANVDKRNGFQLVLSTGRQTARRIRTVTAAGNPTNPLSPGDAYVINADGTISRQTSTTGTVNGIVEAIVLQGINDGPVSYESLPAATTGAVIGIEDPGAEFQVTASIALALSDYDTGARVTLVDAADDLTLNTSRQAVGAINGSGPFNLIQPLDQINNDQFAQYARVIVRIVNVVQ